MSDRQRGNRKLVVAGTVGVLASGLVIASLGVAAASGTGTSGSGSAPVLVVNTSASPVPIAGTVNVANLPGSQTVSGTVSVSNFPTSQSVSVSNFPSTQAVTVSSPQRRAGNFFFQTTGGFGTRQSVPTGVVVTDMVFSRTAGGATSCEVQPTFGSSGFYLGRFDVQPSQIRTINLTTGLESSSGSQVSFNIVTSDPAGCSMYVAWSGFDA